MDKVVHFQIPVEDMSRAKKFYKDIFGWEIIDTGMGQDYQLANTVATDKEECQKNWEPLTGLYT